VHTLIFEQSARGTKDPRRKEMAVFTATERVAVAPVSEYRELNGKLPPTSPG